MSASGDLTLEEWPTLYWSISKFPSKGVMKSPTFVFRRIQFRFILELYVSRNIGDDYYNMFLARTEGDVQESQEFETCLVSVRIQNKDYVESFFAKASVTSSVLQSSICVWSQERKRLLSRYDDLKVTDDNNVERLRFRCIFGPLETDDDKEKDFAFEQQIDCLKQLSLDYSKLLETHEASDIALKCGDRTFEVHKSILLARCENILKDTRIGSVEITDMQPGILQQLLEYIYTGRLTEKSKKNIFRLYEAGMKYSFQALTESCADYIIGNLNAVNVHEALVIAYKSGDAAFKKYLLGYCAENEVDTGSHRWLKICECLPDLACDVYQAQL